MTTGKGEAWEMNLHASSDPCACDKCVAACKAYPGWPTPQEAMEIIDKEGWWRLMLDYWERDANLPDIPFTFILAPAVIGHGGKFAPAEPWTPIPIPFAYRCTFLSKVGKCRIHDTDYKPIECRTFRFCNPAHD